MARKQEYGNESITSLKGADRVRKRPAVIFGSDGVEGCAHSIFEIVSNSIDEARDGHGDTINVTRCKDGSVIVEDFGRGMPVDWNNGEGRYNWELLFCEMYAGGKYGEGEDNYEFSLGLNGLGLCATQYASAWMTADIYRDGFHYHLDFKKGENVGGLQKEPYKGRRTGSIIHWKPDDEVFTDIDVPGSYYKDVLRRQAVVNAGLTLNFTDEKEKDPATGKPWKESWCYQNGIADYVQEVAGEDTLTPVFSCESEASGRDREDQPDYKVRMSAAFCFSNKVQLLEYYHNSSWLEHGGSPEHAVRTAFVYQINKYLKDKNLYKKGESKIVGFLRQGAGVVTTRAHVRYIVTEYGIADLYGKSLRERARAIIDIAHPDHRENLEKIAREQLSLRLYSVCNKHAIECRALVSLPRSANNTSSAGSFDGAMTGHRETTYTNASSS